MKRNLFLFAAVLAALFSSANSSEAGGGRKYTGGHPYHNGYYFVPPASAYQAVTVRPPFWYGVPAYYYPQSYLSSAHGYYPTVATYPGVPLYRSGAYWMAATTYYPAYYPSY